MNDIQPFAYGDTEVRTILGEDGEPRFVLRDVCAVLDLDPKNVTRSLPDGVCSTHPIVDSLGRTQQATFVTEGGLYRVAFRSRKPEAEAFTAWVSDEVLPAIRKHGGYLTPAAVEATLTDPDFIIRLATTLKEERAARLTAETALAVAAPKATKWDAFLGLDGYVSLNDAAKALAKAGCVLNGRPVGRNRLMEWLRDRRHLNADNTPSQRQVEAGRFVLFTGSYTKPDGEHVITTSTKVTPRGLDWLHGLLVADAEGAAA